jgi:subtilisin family serine protease
MKKKSIFKYVLFGAFAVSIIGCQTDSNDEIIPEAENATFQKAQPIEGSYIVVYNNVSGKVSKLPQVKSKVEYSIQMSKLKTTFSKEFKSIDLKEEDISATFGYALNGFAAKLTEAQVEALRNNPKVQSVEQDFILSISPFKGPGHGGGGNGGGGTPDPQVIPYGTARVGGGGANISSNNTAWVIDTGIDLDHPDLNVDTNRSASFLRKGGPDDQNGHGTHVAGTIAAINNTIGSVGVAPGATVVAVRVLDRRGSGSNSGVIAGVDYVAANGQPGDVANMSLGGGVSTALDNAVIAAASKGIKFSLAAGNSGADANTSSPARANGANIFTISAMDSSDNWASFSNYGNPPVDYCAPGVAVFSLWKDGGYNNISGTSMAAPHAAGVLLLGNESSDGTVNGDPDGNADSIIHN